MSSSTTDSNILFQNEDVCILRPDAPGGVLVFTHSTSKNICTEGLYSFNELRRVHPELGLKPRAGIHIDPDHNDLIFFRAPYNGDTSTFESSFNGKPVESMLSKESEDAFAIIRVDPEKTYVYASEARPPAHRTTYQNLKTTRTLLSTYLQHLQRDKTTNIFSERRLSDAFRYYYNIWGMSKYRMFEIVVKTPHIPPDWFVKCVHNDITTIRQQPIAAASGGASASAGGGGASASAGGGTFEPIWVKREEFGDCVIQCPECKLMSGSGLILGHTYACSNKNKIPNLSNKVAECAKLGITVKAGGARRTHRRRNRRQKKSRRHQRRKRV